ncbi:hypothetical protein [Kribbella sp. NPDC051770]|uniref:hypothetical protein n=1 Tax=Kribbella sp. NPDC051770 TaxID=3155413 RepID=UPI0034346BF7
MKVNRAIDQVVPGNGAWVIEDGQAYAVRSFLYWHEVADNDTLLHSFTVTYYGRCDGDETYLIPFTGWVFASKKEARRWCNLNGREFNEGEL